MMNTAGIRKLLATPTGAALAGVWVLLALYFVTAGISPSTFQSNWDAYSEANALRAGQCYAEEGFFKEGGLPNTTYGEMFPYYGHEGVKEGEYGFKYKQQRYTHYPPGPDFLSGLYHLLLPADWVWAMRFFPFLFFGIALSWLLLVLRRQFGEWAAVFTGAFLMLTPAVVYMLGNLHLHSYVTSLLLVEVALLIKWLSGNKRALGWLALTGFVQGWMSFDWCFVVVFAPVPLAYVLAKDGRPATLKMIWPILVLGLGFSFAHLLHFFQVAAYYGSFGQAVNDLTGSAAHRSGEDSGGRLTLLRMFVQEQYLAQFFNAYSPGAVSLVLFSGMLATGLLHRLGIRGLIERIRPHRAEWAGVGAAIVIALLWGFAMPQHGLEHVFVLHRHFLLPLLCLLLIAAKRLPRGEPETEEEAPRE